jgi:hypothetical protein
MKREEGRGKREEGRATEIAYDDGWDYYNKDLEDF